MLEPLTIILPDIRSSLGNIPLYTQRSKLNRAVTPGDSSKALPPPYALLLPVSEPEDPNRDDSVLTAGLNVWGPLWQVSQIAASLRWLNRKRVSEDQGLLHIRYKKQGGAMDQEEGAFMPDGVTEVWNLSRTYRCTYVRLTGGVMT